MMEQSSIKPPNLMKISSNLVVKWVDGMAGSAPSYQDELGSLCRPEKVGGLGAKIRPNAAAATSSADPVERKLQRKVYVIKKKSAKDSEKMIPIDDNRLDGEDDKEPESRIKALTKRRALHAAAPPQRFAKKINK